ncbi:GGDEF domain-containing protein [Haloplasma contractile]|uniref:GGDEF-HD domain protein n=1 Tax=Haloplasma contractile SSD-17B TaxID=1033810 RepID=U2FLH9_9MOLU|nr:GGDEF domain-containing protein [Haloplasma contractile]ERJ12029.1 GGDEF-HD domain protein [Haloplasma contractile SSD-17B]
MIEFKKYLIKNKEKWNKTMIRHYRNAVIISFIAEIIIYVGYHPEQLHIDYLYRYVLIPTLLLFLIMVLLNILLLIVPKAEDYLILSTGSIIITILAYINNTVTVLGIAYILPIIISIFYYEKSKVLFAFITNVTLFLFMNIYLFKYSSIFSLSNFVTSIVIMIVTILIARGMINEMKSIMRHIKIELETKQNLIAEKTMLEKSLKMDGLTNLYNHSTFQTELKKGINFSNTNRIPLGLAIIDIDDFKLINDTYGHQAGDRVIKQVADIIKNNISKNDLASRYGGEEYTIIMINHSNGEAIKRLETIRKKIEMHHSRNIDNHNVTVSIGYMEYSRSMTKDVFFEKTDRLLYEAKHSGKNKLVTK